LNEASLPFSSAADCKGSLDEFFVMLHRVNSQGVTFYRADNIEGDWNSLDYSDGFELGKWINEIQDIDHKRLVRSVLGNVKCPVVSTPMIEHDSDSFFVLSSDQNIDVKGLGVASVIDSRGISFASQDCWKSDPVNVTKFWTDEAGNCCEQNIDVPNIFSLAQVNGVLANFKAQRESNKQYLCKLQVDGNQYLPNLIFCENALTNFKSSFVTTQDFPKIVDSLNKLNNAIGESNNAEELVEKTGLDITGESTSVMNNRKLSRQREFNHPKLGKQSFYTHVKNFPDNKRMHILPDYQKRIICIGYFGRHLPLK